MKNLKKKTRTLLALITSMFLFVGHLKAQSQRPLLVMENAPGYQILETMVYEKCEIFEDKVQWTNAFGNAQLKTVREESLQITGDLKAMIAAASLESLETVENFLCDAPTSYLSMNTQTGSEVLFQSGGCGQDRLMRNGSKSILLTTFIAKTCGMNIHYN